MCWLRTRNDVHLLKMRSAEEEGVQKMPGNGDRVSLGQQDICLLKRFWGLHPNDGRERGRGVEGSVVR